MTTRSTRLIRKVPLPFALLAGISLTTLSLSYKYPSSCAESCISRPCYPDQCSLGQEEAGFPLPMVRDAERGSPTSGMGKVGLEDFAYSRIEPFIFNIGFYSLISWLLIKLAMRLFLKVDHKKLVALGKDEDMTD